MTERGAPLAGLIVLELGHIYNGPYCGLLLAAEGATVIKLEPPGGDPLRRPDRARGGASYPFLMLNAGKQGVVVDLKQDRGRDVFLRMVERADVVVENFAAGVMERLGLAWEVLHARNPRIVLGSASGFGPSGAYASSAAMDFTIQALVGAMEITGFPDQPPVKAGPAFIDMLGGVHLFAGILLALRERERTGQGRHVDVAMYDTAVAPMLSYLAPVYEWQRDIGRTGNRQAVGSATPYNSFRCRDGHVAILCVTNQHWYDLCRVMDRPDLLADPRWRDGPERQRDWAELEAEVEKWTSTRARDDAAARVAAAGVPCAPVRRLSEAAADPHLFERGVVREVAYEGRGTVKVLGSPIRFAGRVDPPSGPPPRIGQHTDDVLQQLAGLTADEIARLRADGVVGPRADG